jgi:putative protease
MKILSPAGNMECLRSAVFNGADEVYLGINDFNARNNINSFTLDNLGEAVEFCHIFGVRVLLAINISFKNIELENAVKTLISAYNLGVDAFIVSDLGLAKIIIENYPEIELHASTQMAVHNLSGVRFLEKFGFKRVVLARETPLDDIKKIRENSSIELEYFCQGALCVCFSGNCYLSEKLFDASGNRGRCKQLCRLNYKLKKDDKIIKEGYLLSAKDINMSMRIRDLIEAGVDCIKIEGRARRPFFVATATREYFNALHKEKVSQDNLRLAFNREYTEGYFNSNKNIISKFQNHIGVELGKVVDFKKGKNFNQIIISAERELTPKSVLKFYDNDKEDLTLTAYDVKLKSDGLYLITTTNEVKIGSLVRLIADGEKENNLPCLFSKRKVKIALTVKENQEISARCIDKSLDFTVTGEQLKTAINNPLTREEVVDCFNKNQYFIPEIQFSAFENVFIAKSQLNKFRREFYERLITALTDTKRQKLNSINVEILKKPKIINDFCYMTSINDSVSSDVVIFSPEKYVVDEIVFLKNKCESEGKKFYLELPNFALEKDVEFLRELVDKTKVSVVANNLYALDFSKDTVIGWGLNVYNDKTAEILNLPYLDRAKAYEKKCIPLMTLRHCPIKEHISLDCQNCKYQDGYEYSLGGEKTYKLKRKKLNTCTFYLMEK